MAVTGSKRDKMTEIHGSLSPMELPKDIIVATPEEVEKYRGIPGTIIRPALLEGKVL